MAAIIIKYKAFQSSEELEQWQLDNDVVISAVTPIITNLAGDVESPDAVQSSAKFDTTIGCFVTYFDAPKRPDAE